MNIKFLLITYLLSVFYLHGAELAKESDESMLREFRSLMQIEPHKRTHEQKARVREIWRISAEVKNVFPGVSVLQAGDSIFDFPGLIAHIKWKYDETKREYQAGYSYSIDSADGGKDRVVIVITFSEDGIVTNREHMKVNSR